ncbi:MAG: flagellar export protein FliJ [Verrucomicrobiales bacterium]|nr:flagellar export protein FliJ [Verrucomicrobiales bacterium]
MKRFRFSLHALLAIRKRQETEAQERYAAVLARQRQAANQVALADSDLGQAAGALRSSMGRGMVAAEFAQRGDHLRALELRRAQAAVALARVEHEVPPALDSMLLARRQREVVEKFESRQRDRHEREFLRREEKENDELALRRFAPAVFTTGHR